MTVLTPDRSHCREDSFGSEASRYSFRGLWACTASLSTSFKPDESRRDDEAVELSFRVRRESGLMVLREEGQPRTAVSKALRVHVMVEGNVAAIKLASKVAGGSMEGGMRSSHSARNLPLCR